MTGSGPCHRLRLLAGVLDLLASIFHLLADVWAASLPFSAALSVASLALSAVVSIAFFTLFFISAMILDFLRKRSALTCCCG